ncbi:MAG: ABC transporter ATP-binding protein [Planctomycetota bacterium]|nr:ABC transporter ATP-binding protein [Planctomycetota bacterium]
MSRAALHVEGVSRWYGDVMALNGVELQLESGVTGLLGPNGAGKTTLIKLLVGLAEPGDGKVTLDGVPVRNSLECLSRLGYVMDGDSLYEDITAQRFVTDQARARGYQGSAAENRAQEILEFVGLEEAAHRPVRGYSKGMRQRVKLAQALVHSPDVLVLDEPLTGLDPVMRRDFIQTVKRVGDEGVTVVVSSHVLHEVEAMTNRIVLLHHGQVLAEGDVREIRDLIETHARRYRLGSPDPRALGRILLDQEETVASLSFDVGGVIVETHSPSQFCQLVQQLCAEGTHPVSSLEPLDEGLLSIFDYLVD